MNATRRPHAPTRRRAQRLHRLRRCVTPTAFAAAMACMLPAQAADYGWYAGSYTSTFLPTTITLNDTLWLDCPPAYCGTKVLNTDLVNNGTLIAQDTLYWYYGNTLTNNWQIELRGDVGLRDQYGYNWLVNNSGLVKTAGTGESVITVNSAHASGAIVDAMVGTLNFAGGSANFANGAILMAAAGAGVSFTGGSASFADGVRFTGDGQYLMAANASFGGAVGAKNLTFSNASWTGGDGAGNPATLTSNATWSGGGTFNGQWAVASGQQLNLVGTGSNKYIGSSASLVNHGTIDAQDDLRFYYASGLDNRGTYRLNGDVSLYEGYGYSGFTNSGTVAKVAGAGSSVSNVNFYNSGTVRADSGTLNFVGGGLYFHDGTQFRGAGRVQVSTNANFDGAIGSENLVLTGGSWQGSNATLSGQTVWQDSGTLNGQWTVASGAQLRLTGAGNKYIGSSANLTNRGTVQMDDTLRLYYASGITNHGQWNVNGDLGLYESYGYSGIDNQGTLTKTTGTGEATVTAGFHGGGASRVEVNSGSMNFAAGGHSFDTGATFQAAAGTAVSFTGGSASFADAVRFTGDGQYLMAANASFGGAVGATNLTFTNASWTGGDGAGHPATLTSNATWSGNGSFNGQWAVASGQQLSLVGSGTKYIGSSASLVNHGTIDAQDDLRFYYASGLDNRGTYRLNGDVSLYEGYGYSGFTNSGTVAKVAGAGSSVSNVNFYNSGTVRADSGTLNFVGGGLYFHDGTQFRGAGRVQVSTNANFDGAIGSENLVLTGGSWQGSNATLSGRTVWQDSGTLNGQWTVASGAQLHLTGAGNKYIGSSATLTNHGTVEMNDTLRLYYASTVDNHGQWNINGDHGLYESYGYSQVVNQGTITKTAGAGTSQIGVAFTNLGTVDVRSGTIELPANFNNAGTLQGIGSFRTNQLYNAGHVGIGGAPGTLTLDGHLTQLASGTLDFNLFHLGATDRLNVMGNVLLDGTLALNCFGACSFAMGADILLLDGHGSLSGAFSNLALTGFAPGSFNVVYDSANADVWLHVNQNITAAVPEPETYALFLAGLGLLGISARRRHLSQS